MAEPYRESGFPWFDGQNRAAPSPEEINALALHALEVRRQEDYHLELAATDPLRTERWQFSAGAEAFTFYIADSRHEFPDVRIVVASCVGDPLDDGKDEGKQLFRCEDYNFSNRAFFARRPMYKAAVGELIYMLEDAPINPGYPRPPAQPKRDKVHLAAWQRHAFGEATKDFQPRKFTRSNLEKLGGALLLALGPASSWQDGYHKGEA